MFNQLKKKYYRNLKVCKLNCLGRVCGTQNLKVLISRLIKEISLKRQPSLWARGQEQILLLLQSPTLIQETVLRLLSENLGITKVISFFQQKMSSTDALTDFLQSVTWRKFKKMMAMYCGEKGEILKKKKFWPKIP